MKSIQNLQELFIRDLHKLKVEISSYSEESLLWKVEAGISNSAGNLALHICGNLQHFIGAMLGESGYVRTRDVEFSSKNIPLSTILNEIEQTEKAIALGLQKITAETLDENYPIEVFGYPMTVEYFLFHLLTHLSYHLGQINYHRRLLDHL